MATTRYRVTVGEREYGVEVSEDDERLVVAIGGERHSVDLYARGDNYLTSALLDGESLQALVRLQGAEGTVVLRGVPLDVSVQDERLARLASLASTGAQQHAVATLKSPMPGLVVKINCAVGQAVHKGEPLVVLQAMKMENELSAPRNGTVKQIQVSTGQTVEHNQALIVLE